MTFSVQPTTPSDTLSSVPPTAGEVAVAVGAGLVFAVALLVLGRATWQGRMRARWWWVIVLLVCASAVFAIGDKGLSDPQSTGIAPAAYASLIVALAVPALMLAGLLGGLFRWRGFPLAGSDTGASVADRRGEAAAAGAIAALTAVVYVVASVLLGSARDLNPSTGPAARAVQLGQIAIVALSLGGIAFTAGRRGRRNACVATMPLVYAACLLIDLSSSSGGLDAWAIGAEVVLAYVIALGVTLVAVAIGESAGRGRGRKILPGTPR